MKNFNNFHISTYIQWTYLSNNIIIVMSHKGEGITCFQLSNVTLTCQFLDSTGKGPYLQEAVSIHDNGLTV